LEALAESSGAGVIVLSVDGLITGWSTTATDLFGYSGREAVGHSVAMLIDTGSDGELVAQLLAGEVPAGQKAGWRHRDGSVVELAVTGWAVTDEAGRTSGVCLVLGQGPAQGLRTRPQLGGGLLSGPGVEPPQVAGVSLDISNRMSGEEAAGTAEDNYRLLFDSNPLPMWVYDAETLQFLEVNDAAVRIYGYSREEFRRMTLRDIRPAEDIPELLRSAANFDPMDRSGPWRHRKNDGTVIDVEVTSHVVPFSDRPARFVVIADVTERERLQRQLLQSQRLESLGQLAGGVAHDFNNLLAVIMTSAEFVMEQLPCGPEPTPHDRSDVRRDVEQIQQATARAARLTHQLLAFARREVIQPKRVDLNDEVRHLEELLRRTIKEDIHLVLSLADDLQPILADPGQLEQVLVNVAVNARDAMPAGGTLTVETRNFDVDDIYASSRPQLKSGAHVLLRVSDTGSGMDSETLQHVFEPFFTTKAKGQGTGLGLATIYGIITQMGGHTQLYSEPGLGTTFTALIPATDRAAATPTEGVRPESAVPPTGTTVLVVEDQEAVRQVTLRILDRGGYQALAAASGPEAIEIARSHQGVIDILLTDVVMPTMQGKEVAQAVTALYPHVGVVYMSGYAEPLLGGQGYLDPDAALVEKPFTQATLLGKLREV
jgi:hypothetical protein